LFDIFQKLFVFVVTGGFDVYNIETAMPKIDLDAIESHLRAAREEERRVSNVDAQIYKINCTIRGTSAIIIPDMPCTLTTKSCPYDVMIGRVSVTQSNSGRWFLS
jgi:hypothetical protein